METDAGQGLADWHSPCGFHRGRTHPARRPAGIDRHAEQIGQITGINTNGRRLKDPGFVESLVEAGLDHVQITLESHDAAIHDQMVLRHGAWQDTTAGIRNVLSTPSCMS